MKDADRLVLHKDGTSYILPSILAISCLTLWGFTNDIVNPTVKAFLKIFRISVTDGTLVQVTFYGGYFTMAFPAAMFIRKYSYKVNVLLGLGLYTLGTLLFFPVETTGGCYPLLLAYFILTCGLSFLEAGANPYILSMGTEETTVRRLSLAQSFNPIEPLLGMYTAMNFVQVHLNLMDTVEHSQLSPSEFRVLKESDLSVLTASYLTVGLMILAIFFLIRVVKMPKNGDRDHNTDSIPTLRRIFRVHHYRKGAITQFFYVGIQTMCWASIIQYGTHLLMLQGVEEKATEVLPQEYNIIAMIILCISRFMCTFTFHYLSLGMSLRILTVADGAFTLGVTLLQSIWGLYCLVAVSTCMLLIFPTIYGVVLRGLGDGTKSGAAGLIMTILGGSVLPLLQACTIDQHTLLDMPAVNLSFILPLIYFVVAIIYGHRTYVRMRKIKAARK